MPRMGDLADLDTQETVFQQGIRATPWFSEYQKKYNEEPDLNTSDYDYRTAWASGARPTVRDPGDQLLHWPSQFKGDSHPNRYVGGVDTKTGARVMPDLTQEGILYGPPQEPAVPMPPEVRPDLSGAFMGSVAAQDRYQPYRGSIATGTTPWKHEEIAAARAAEPRDPTMLDPATNKFLAEQAHDFIVPSSPLDYAMYAFGPAGRIAGKLGKGAVATAGIYGSMIDEAEAAKLKTVTGFMGKILKPEVKNLMEAGAVPRDTYGNWMLRYTPEGAASMEDISGLTGNAFTSLKTGASPDTMSRIVRGGVEPSQGFPVDFADLQKRKAEVVFGPTDRMYGGPALRQAGDTRFDVPIAQEGGINFPQLHADKHIPFMPPDVAPLYASVSRGAATKVNNIANEVLERGGQPWYAPVIMSHGGGDSAKQMAHTTHRALAQADLSEEAIAEINRSVRAKLPKDSDFPGYGKDLPEWLEKAGLGGRRAFVEGVDTGKVAKLTGVDVSQLRFANTDPRLHHTPSGSAGIVMGRMRPDVGVTNFPLHSNYPWAFMGQRGEIGGAPGNMPFSLFAPDMHRDLLKAGVPERFANQPHYYAQQGFPTGMRKTQPITDEVVNNAGEWFRRYPQGWSIAAGAVPVMGALASEERQ